ncbi:MAG TPA: class I SAM-dependent methyltransferase [Pyrinomonadaceae bacterium]|jgi:hypothetical protein
MTPKTFKQLVKSLPYLNELFQERDLLRQQLTEANAARESLAGENAALTTEARTLREARESLDAATRTLGEAVASLERERDSSEAERAALREKNSSLEAARLALESEKNALELEKRELETELERLRTWVPPGHFYSPVPDTEEILRHEHEIWRKPLPRREIPGVDFHEDEQLRLFREFLAYYREQPFAAQPQAGLRYYFENENYSYSDAIFLYCMLRHLRPRRFIEVGSGFSSCATLDTDELFLGSTLSCTFIDPNPELLLSMIKEQDKPRIEIRGCKVQEIEPELFDELNEGDVLFVDSTHVSKTLSDVNHIFFQILPRLRRGVIVHLHDIFYPFVYPKDWELQKRAWNETYLLRAFLQYNDTFRIYFCNTFLEYFHDEMFKKEMPLCMKNTGGSIWLLKTG